jgi:hypothetical protein
MKFTHYGKDPDPTTVEVRMRALAAEAVPFQTAQACEISA